MARWRFKIHLPGGRAEGESQAFGSDRKRIDRDHNPTVSTRSHSKVTGMTTKRIAVGLLALVAVGLLIFVSKAVPGTEYRTFSSPDGRFKVAVFRSRQWLGAMPGQAGDAPGNVFLYEASSGKLLERKHVEMVQLVDEIIWSVTNVHIKFIADWKLP